MGSPPHLEWMVTSPPPTIPTTYPFRSQSIPNFINSHLIPLGMYMYFIIYPLILITSPTAILNLPINLLCPLDTALVLTSDDFHSIFPPLLPLSCLSHTLWWHFSKAVTWQHLYHVFTYIYFLLIKKDICDWRNVSVNFPCVCVCLSSGDLFIFSVRVSSFFSYF